MGNWHQHRVSHEGAIQFRRCRGGRNETCLLLRCRVVSQVGRPRLLQGQSAMQGDDGKVPHSEQSRGGPSFRKSGSPGSNSFRSLDCSYEGAKLITVGLICEPLDSAENGKL